MHLLVATRPNRCRNSSRTPMYVGQSQAGPGFLTVPAKLQAYMACGRPIIAMLDGEERVSLKQPVLA